MIFFHFWKEIFRKPITKDLPCSPDLPDHRKSRFNNVLHGSWIFAPIDKARHQLFVASGISTKWDRGRK
jgi:hypothetical protein